MPGHIGFPKYCRALAMLPATGREIAQEVGLLDDAARKLMRRFWQLRIVRPVGTGRYGAVIWGLDDGEAPVISSRLGRKTRAPAVQIVFASLIRALQDPCTTRQLADETGVSLRSAQQALKYMHAAGIVFIAEWTSNSLNKPFAKYEFGTGRDAPRPPPQSNRAKWSRYTQRLEHRAIQFGRPAANGEGQQCA